MQSKFNDIHDNEGLHALELMDGDASHVPALWVLAVIEKLKVVCGKNARGCVYIPAIPISRLYGHG